MFVDNVDVIWVFGEGVQLGIQKLQNFAHKVIQIASRLDQFYLLTTSLRLYFWTPFDPRPKEFPLNVQISRIAIGGNFVVMISIQGVVLSFGEDNSVGQLGLGDTLPRSEPEVVEELRNKGEKVVQVECGWSHVVCRTSLKKVYTWGWGQRGQLGHEDYQNLCLPKKVFYRESNQNKVIQVAAGYRCSLLLLENGKILWCGSNATINQQNSFCEIDWSIKNPIYETNDFTAVRILSTWSKTMSIIYVTFADSRNAETPNQIKNKIFQTLTSKWEEYGIQNIYAPFIDSISKYFKGRTMLFNQKKQDTKREPQFPLSIKPVISSQQNNQLGTKKQSLLKQFDQQFGKSVQQQQQASELVSNKSGGSDKYQPISSKSSQQQKLQQQTFSPQSMRSAQSGSSEVSEEMLKILIIYHLQSGEGNYQQQKKK